MSAIIHLPLLSAYPQTTGTTDLFISFIVLIHERFAGEFPRTIRIATAKAYRAAAMEVSLMGD
jgi:hypothetical protein